MGPIRDTEQARYVVSYFGLTVRQRPLFWITTRLYSKIAIDSDGDMLHYQHLAARESLRGWVGRMKRKIIWKSRKEGLVDICWYWDYDG